MRKIKRRKPVKAKQAKSPFLVVPFLVVTPIAQLLRARRVVSILPKPARKRPMSQWIKRTGISRMHFYRIVSGLVQANATIVAKFVRGCKLPERTIRQKLDATWRGARKLRGMIS